MFYNIAWGDLMLEKTGEFFEKRLEGYDEHMLCDIEGAKEFYPFTSSYLIKDASASILDLGCGTGIELGYYFSLGGNAKITCIDLSRGMLEKLKQKFSERDISIMLGSYFDLPFPENAFNCAVSVESLHHFTKEEKIPLYKKLRKSLKDGGFFILTDYFAACDEMKRIFVPSF